MHVKFQKYTAMQLTYNSVSHVQMLHKNVISTRQYISVSIYIVLCMLRTNVTLGGRVANRGFRPTKNHLIA